MENEIKAVLMQYLCRFADHYGIKDADKVSFKKRATVLDQLKDINHDAWVIINSLFDAFIKADRIHNDKEKQDKARILWESEHAAAEKEKVNAEMRLIQFCKAQHIPVGALKLEM